MVLLSKFWRILEMNLINREINLILTWSVSYVISNTDANHATTFVITDVLTKIFQGVNRPLVSLFENEEDRIVHTKYYFPSVEIK